ncbi:MAG: CDP-glycerol glycerophosphotransferase family protein [Treponema sp.]|jgi:hypothetical protein|nr:CDP-glycerol glycerophosphotransferase family protein [Treponema sp.]
MNLFPLYIDPGTGSALFSIAIGLAAALYFFLRVLLLRFKTFFHGNKKTGMAKNTFVIYAEDKRYWMFFKPILDEFERRQTELLYLTSSTDDPVFSSGFKHIKGEYIGQGNKAFARLNFLTANVVLSTTPDLGVLQWKRSKTVRHYSHIIHAAGGASLYRIFALDYYDSILLSGESETEEIRFIEELRKLPEKQLVIAGNPYLDMYRKKARSTPAEGHHPFTVLVSPSWGASSLLRLYGEKLLDPLVKTGWRIILRPHPQSRTAERTTLERLAERYKNTANLEWDDNNENIYSLAKSDVMISDFSGIIYDYVFLFDKPVLWTTKSMDMRPNEAYNLEREPCYLQMLKKIGMELDVSNFDSIGKCISGLAGNAGLQEGRRETREMMWHFRGESGKRIADFMFTTAKEAG